MAAYALFLRIGLDSGCAAAMLPTFLLAGLGFGRSFGPLNIAVTSGIAAEEQGWPEVSSTRRFSSVAPSRSRSLPR